MRLAIIDLGTNSVRFDVHQLGPGKTYKQLHREKLQVRLGQGVFVTGKLDPSAINRTIEALDSFHNTAKELKVQKLIAFGTSALREASDSDKFLKKIQQKTGIEIRIISGEEEAHYIARGILANEENLKGSFALVDIGGGSTEISVCKGNKILHATSFALGTARLQQVFLKSVPPRKSKGENKDPVKAARAHIKSLVLTKILAEEWPKVDLLIGSSGAARSVSKILKRKDKRFFSTKELSRFLKDLELMSVSEILNIPGMDPKRVDMMLAGGLILEEIAHCFKAKKIQATEHTLRDGILDEEIQLYMENKGTTLAFHLPELREKTIRLGISQPHTDAVAKHCEALFMALKKLHKLDLKWKPYLIAAAYLHDIGECVSHTDHDEHSYYIVKNSHIPSMNEVETEIVAQLCAQHSGHKNTKAQTQMFTSHKTQEALEKLLALLRVADALDKSHKDALTIQKIQITRNKVLIHVNTKGSAELELLRIQNKKTLFEKVYDRELILKVNY